VKNIDMPAFYMILRFRYRRRIMEDYKAFKKDFSRIGFRYIAGTLAIYLVQIILELVLTKAAPDALSDVNIVLICSMLVTYMVGMPIIYLLMRKMPAKKPAQHKIKPGQFILAAIMCFALMYCSNLAGTILTTIIGLIKGSAVETNAASQIAMSANMCLTFFFMVICAPIIEELVFRKLIVDRTIKYGDATAIFLSGFMFGLFHGNLSQFVYAFALGMFLAFIYIRTGQIKVTMGLHMIINFIGGIVSVVVLNNLTDSGLMDMFYGDYDTEALLVMLSGEEGRKIIMALAVLMLYVLFVVAAVIAGVILFIVFRKKFTFNKGDIILEKGRRFKTVILNPGMIVYCVFWIAMIIYQLIFG
jgi:membrane protease YdiL (CAAX protease family)